MAVYYVSNTGNDGWAGTILQPWETLTHAFGTIIAGDTLYVRGGTYTEIGIHTWHDGPINILAYPGEAPIWTGGVAFNLWHLHEGEYWSIENMILEGRIILGHDAIQTAEYITFRGCTHRDSELLAIRCYYARHVLVDDCYFVNIRSNQAGVGCNAVAVPEWGDDITIQNCIFEDIGTDGIHLGSAGEDIYEVNILDNVFFISGTRNGVWGGTGENASDVKGVFGPITIRGNTVYGFRPTVPGQDATGGHGEGIVLHARGGIGDPVANDVLVEKNLVYDCRYGLWMSEGSDDLTVRNNIFRDPYEGDGDGTGIWVHGTTNTDIFHNTFHNNTYHMQSGGGEITDGAIKNNIFYDGGFNGFPDPGGNSTWEAGYNLFSQIDGGIPTILQGAFDVEADDPELDSDLRPEAGSPAIDMGDDLGVTDDYDGNARDDLFPDVGAFEYRAQGTGVWIVRPI